MRSLYVTSSRNINMPFHSSLRPILLCHCREWTIIIIWYYLYIYGDLLVPIILAKPKQYLARKNASPEWTLPELISAILKEIRVLESGFCVSRNPQPQFSTATFHIGSMDTTRSDTQTRKGISASSVRGHTQHTHMYRSR